MGSVSEPEQSAADTVLQTVAIDRRWPTIDPFLFCVHHDDAYPPGNDHLGPDAPLRARDIGQDFSGADGWSMYHGSIVPGFPRHPHRGFETLTLARRGLIDHSDSLGATARFGSGDAQWLTAGAGIVHSEMFPLVNRTGDNHTELFQIWLNLPAADKMAEPYFTMLWDRDIPKVRFGSPAGPSTTVTLVAGSITGHDAPAPPPDSWAARPDADVAVWVISMDPGAEWELPAAHGADTNRVLYVFEGELADIGGHAPGPSTAVVLRGGSSVRLRAGHERSEALLLQGRPIGEPVEQYGPFVMNDHAGIEAAFADYRRTGFGGWPWTNDDPVHGPDRGRFARHADGRVEEFENI